MGTIYLIRHGEIAAAEPRRFVGQRDLPLTEHGREQMVRLAEALSGYAIHRVVCSPLRRSRESAAILCRSFGGAAEVQPALAEIALGGWEGLSVTEVKERYPGSHEARGRDLAGFRPPGGESFGDLQERVWPVFETVACSPDERVAVVAHAGVNRVLICRLLGLPLDRLFRLPQQYGCVNTISHDAAGYRIECINCSPGRIAMGESR